MRGTLAAAAALVCASTMAAQSAVVFNPAKIEAILRNGSTVVSIPLENSADHPVAGNVDLQWLLPSNQVANSVSREVIVQPGKQTLEIPMRLKDASVWLRLRYSFTPSRAEPEAFRPQSGIMAISQIAPYVFEVKAAHDGLVQRGAPLTIHAQAIHPASRAPVDGVQWTATLQLNDVQLKPIRIAPSDAGFVDFVFDVPPAAVSKASDDEEGGRDEAVLDLKARLGDFERQESFELELSDASSAKIQTDKPIYQPSQTIHLRALVFDSMGRAAEGIKLTLEIEDADNETVHRADLTTSRFGIAGDEWALPENAALGEYRIQVRREGRYQAIARHVVRVGRYELPEFNVTAKPDKGAYLPGQEVAVAIRGSYLFGKPVPNGKVKIVRSREGSWNARTRKFDKDEETAAGGEADSQGLYTAHLDITKDFADFRDREWMRYQDLEYAAYFTDPVSGRTEQRRFAVRITNEPIHVYVVVSYGTGPLPAPVYISTFYADGRPAETSLEIGIEGRGTQATARTNKYGVAKANVVLGGQGDRTIEVRARDASGALGTSTERVFLVGDPRMRLETDRTVYRAGDSVTLHLRSPEKTGAVMVNAVANDRSVATRVVRIVNGTAEVTFSYQAEFRRQVMFIAWNGEKSEGPTQYNLLGARGAIFPDDSGLRVSVAKDKSVYRPGEQASLRFAVSDAGGRPVESALGVAVVDQAVTERARTDTEFGERHWFACAFCGGPDDSSIGDVRLSDLYNLRKAVSPELDLVAEMLMARDTAYLSVQEGENLNAEQTKPFEALFHSQMAQIQAALDKRYLQTFDYPRDQATLASWLGNIWYGLHDPWGKPYSARFHVEQGRDVMEIVSAGPDQKEGTADDFVIGTTFRRYFLPMESVIHGILSRQEDYPATEDEFRKLLAENGLNIGTLRDPWGTPYRALVQTFGSNRNIQIRSAGPDRSFGSGDDFVVNSFQGRYFQHETAAIAHALAIASAQPHNESEFRSLLEHDGIDIAAYRDAWGHPYKLQGTVGDTYADRRTLSTVRIYGGPAATRTNVTPVTRTVLTFSFRSAGPDGIEGTPDDFDVASFPIVLREESAEAETPKSVAGATATGAGTIAGRVLDPAGVVVASATITCLWTAGAISYEAQSDERGDYRCANLAAGTYTVQARSPGFRVFEMREVPVTEGKTTNVDVTLDVGSTAESVTVTAAAPTLNTESGQLAVLGVGMAISTPRVRDYFPETLLWTPELITDSRGAVGLKLALADSVTTWKVAVMASTVDGRTAETAADVRAFQPFFLDFNPPPVLTAGDRVDLPVTARNYLDREQKVGLSWQTNAWSKLNGPEKRVLTVASNSSASSAYSIQALNAADSARQRISAIAGANRDAIEKNIRVHPDGQQVTQTFGDLAAGRIGISLTIPPTAIPGATRGELRLYPNVLSLLLEGARQLIEGPHACAEQTVSTGYANLVVLRYAKAVGVSDSKTEKLALQNVTMARDGLDAFWSRAAGVSYWPGGDADIAVTAHALSFLADASAVVKIEPDELTDLANWLAKKQAPDGRWTIVGGKDDDLGSLLLTAVVARALAAAQRTGVTVPTTALTNAYHHLALFTAVTDEPYMLAMFTLAALDSNDDALVKDVVNRLAALARAEKGALYWDLRTNTPFYGWGTAGRLETSALAVSALAEWRARHPEDVGLDETIRRGSVFALRERDRAGAWFSTQATLRAMQALAGAAAALGHFAANGGGVDVRVNGRQARTVRIPDDPRATDPILIDISSWLASGQNRVEIIPSNDAGVTLVRAVAEHWVPWPQAQARSSNELRLSVAFDRTEARIGEPIQCLVKAERVGFRGYGMMLAEIGLPPGTEVDRSSLESALEDASLGVNRYEIRPDRVVFYLWPRAGGASFSFSLRARIAMRAESAQTVLYDYYNPDERTEVTPQLFTIQ